MFQHPAVLRGAPLGWTFPLAFLVQGLMPAGGAIGASFATPSTAAKVAIIAGGSLLSIGIVALLLRFALRARARIAGFYEAMSGPRAELEVLEVVELGGAGHMRRGGQSASFRKAWVRVRCHLPGHAPFERACEACYTTRELRGLVPGARVVA
ncbi:MAG: hypothetical protein IT373_24715, partial [Polyangiaceae bacterium]|nr:hypothetical protein [Polyangiaceae bacterium]